MENRDSDQRPAEFATPQFFPWAAAMTLLMEGVTCLMRFGLGMQSSRDTSALAAWTFNLRIHHSYLGVLAILLGLAMSRWLHSSWGKWIIIIGVGAVASDLVHHFLVLWPITGSPQFDLIYAAPTEVP